MKYMLLVYLDEQILSEAEREQCYVKSAQLAQEIHSNGQYLDASPLYPTSTATSIRVREGKRQVTDGPFAVPESLQTVRRSPAFCPHGHECWSPWMSDRAETHPDIARLNESLAQVVRISRNTAPARLRSKSAHPDKPATCISCVCALS